MKSIFTILLFMLCTVLVNAQDHEKSNNQDTIRSSYLDEIVISANRIQEQRKSVSQQVKVIDRTTIRSLNAQTSADLISNSGLVAMQKSQQGGGSPMLRGFEASRVLLVVDGVRMNNAIYRAGHLQNIITMDNAVLDRAEILFGPSSTIYGSDALGGVIHFYTRSPQLSTDDASRVGGNVFFRYGSVNLEKTGHVDINLGGKKFGSLTSFTFSDFRSLTMGEKTNPALGEQFGVRNQYVKRSPDNNSDVLVDNDDPFKQISSGYKQYDLLQKFLFKPSERISHLLNIQYSNSTDVPRYDRLTDSGSDGTGLRFAEWYYGPQKRLMGSYEIKVSDLGSLADAFSTTISYQSIEESRHDRRFNNNNRNDRTENIDVWGLTAEFNKTIGKSNLRYGIDGQFNSLESTAKVTDIVTHAESPQSTRYPDGDNTMSTFAAFATHTVALSDKLILNDGLRFGGSWLHSTFVDKTFFPFPYDEINQNNLVGSGNIGLIYSPSSWRISLLGSTGYRVPNIDDMAKVFESVAGDSNATGTLVVPNPDLKPEKTINGDLSIAKFFGDKFRIEGVFFVTKFYDAIGTRPTTFNGQPVFDYDGYPANVVSSQNVGEAFLYGWSASVRGDITSALVITASYNYQHGEVINGNRPDTPLDHIAPAFGRIGIQYNTTKLKTEIFSNFSGWKYLSNYSSSGEDNLQYATAEGMPSWYTINVRASYDATKMLTVQAGIDNLLDLQYRTFASGINSPGRNVFVTLRAKI